MNHDGTQQKTAEPRGWPGIGARLAALAVYAANLGDKYRGVQFGRPAILKFDRQAAKWSASDGTEAWLKAGANAISIGVKFNATAGVGRLVFWAFLDTADAANTISGLVVTRLHEHGVVGRSRRAASFSPHSQDVCVLVMADICEHLDDEMLSSLAKGFSEAASAEDRAAWSTWIRTQASFGYIREFYAESLIAKVLGSDAPVPRLPWKPTGSIDLVRALESVGAFEHEGDYRLPSGLHSATHFNLAKACGHPEMIHELACHLGQLLVNCEYDAIVTTGWPTGMIAREFVRMRPLPVRALVRVCYFEGYPPVPLSPVTRGSRVVVLTDIIVTGGLVKAVVDIVKSAAATIAQVIAVVDGSNAKQTKTPFTALCKRDVAASPANKCRGCEQDSEEFEFNAVSCEMTRRKMRPRSPGEFLRSNPDIAQFWEFIDVAHAYERHRRESNKHYTSFIDTERLLTHETIGPAIVGKLLQHATERMGTPNVFLIPARGRSRRLARRMLCAIKDRNVLWTPTVVEAQTMEGGFRVSAEQSQFLRGAKVLIVDTGASSGFSIEELYGIANAAGALMVGAAVIVSRMSDSQERALLSWLRGCFWRLFQLPIRPHTVPDEYSHFCPVCNRLGEIQSAASESQSEPILRLSRELNSRRARKSRGSTAQNVGEVSQRQFVLISKPEAPLLQRCGPSTASGITLHSLHAGMNDGMAPLELPETCDDSIPIRNRRAMVENLQANAWAGSSQTLLADAKRWLENHDPDQLWVAWVKFLNQGSCPYWIEALQQRLDKSGPARQQAPENIWSYIAYESYKLAKRSPQDRAEICHRYEAMRQACRNTPAEAVISPILDLILELDQ
jgi:orotate phosphoribosyltransferase